MFDMFSLKGKAAVVTGANRGLGKGIAAGLARAGADIVVIDIMDPAASVEDIRALGVNCYGIQYDMRDFAGYDELVRCIIARMGKIDILANVAGIQIRHLCSEYPMEDWDHVMDVNSKAVFFMSQTVGKHMLERGSGKIINIASMLSYQGGAFSPAYAGSKGAVAQFTKSMGNEWISRGVNVNCLAPGYMDTELNAALIADPVRSVQILERIPAGRWGKPSDLAGAAVFLASSASDYMSGAVIPVDGGWLCR
jgi:2-deoxy-D-gluconate 3-dehydrogenase